MEEKFEGRCMRCRKQVEIIDAIIGKNKRGLNMAKGHCGTCNTKVCRILGKDKNETK